MNRIDYIRHEEKKYHDLCYEQYKLFETGSWLYKPVKTVMNLMDYFEGRNNLQVLDLGSGVGRNSIPIAQKIKNASGTVTCVDLLDSALTKLQIYSQEYDVFEVIKIEQAAIENYYVHPNTYDYIVAVSSLEHVQSEEDLKNVLHSMKKGTKIGGINCLIINSNIQEIDLHTKEELDALIEINLPTDNMIHLLKSIYKDWQEIKVEIKELAYNIVRNERHIQLKTNAITFVVQK
ncbi:MULTISPECIES: class I SAM-dependent methyltransferase [Bacillus]|uniref:SAM-dependent methyltransferase n=1 Tax=Bacillus thuringiensis serovar sooncheon TaxID=180891 RepID=A0A9Q5SKK4_BACTU|nr:MULTISPECIES: class I SAM-dependent methyltransferase [Bacillus]MDC7975307.1 class I SAM-dependent methyltransferase [Bacillus sp. BLCC-B18]OTW72605.1 SAM-dependent methyltransferase [Bacillus thuringiensis serovar coreanensis]OTX49661.1 SAM-dependent methyltransferase [Bacillus thuringiensis serovar sooncheon]OTX57162.1 SAM-dependent methyltransferase [Bacillus thuringiensis serovar guiyangiensis]OTX71994.1 SAM-dependent methyltransferase [Bacillus thuringiensis serovar roskildiensis]